MLLFIDPCGDDYAVGDGALFWSTFSATSIVASGRLSVGAYTRSTIAGGALTQNLTVNAPTLITGFAFRVSSLGTANPVFRYQDGSTVQCEVYLNTNGSLQVYRGSEAASLAVSSASLISTNTWYYIEFKATIHNTTGAFELRLNGSNIASGSSVNTRAGTNNYANAIALRGIGTSINTDHDDVYCCDDTGTVNNNFLGETRVECLGASSAGTTTQLTPSTGSNYQNVDEALSNGDTDYNSTATTGQYDTYGCDNLSSTPTTVFGVQSLAFARKDDAGAHTASVALRSGSTDYFATAVAVSSTYAAIRNIYETDPATSAAWTASGVNAAEAGIKLVT